MRVEFEINSSTSAAARYLTWAPSPCRIRVSDPSGVTGSSVNLTLESRSSASAGRIGFRRGTSGTFRNSLSISVPTNGSSVRFFCAGRFGFPSTRNRDVRIEARQGRRRVGGVRVMVRVRKNAIDLTGPERDRFLSAMARLNRRGRGRFTDFREMHTNDGSPQAHGGPGFLPWHRIYLLDLERELQAIDSSVALPYWRFDQPAARVFRRNFMGSSDTLGNVEFSPSNPLRFWSTDGVQGITRRPFFDTSQTPPAIRTEAATLALGGLDDLYSQFQTMEGNPHGTAHTRFGGSISSIGTAARDPLFFMLHCNVDRLWAKWQQTAGRFDAADPAAFDNTPNRIGHNLADTMWPWNGITGGDRPSTAPGGALAASPCVNAPGPEPEVRDTLDYHGTLSQTRRLGFGYDDVRLG